LYLALLCASGQSIGPFVYAANAPTNVLIINAEDNVEEQARRMIAMRKTEDFRDVKIQGGLHTLECNAATLVKRDPKDGSVLPTDLYVQICKEIIDKKIGLLIVDPLIEVAEGVDENKADQHHQVLKALRAIARTYNIVVLVVHHFAKGA